ncbi:rod shape-determining protein RodA [Thioflavicoccus mobilis 8321]|uniref:Peptidoglycan glycosyltransferase MrdB n=1 Tax=Thioflavicoccus mobilis 8321 TaxID=765912 RepID=L0GXL6_9GAMM|nr:rod shape-determining protein RodA [Thioflavicoccus mobilis]AGA91488.1 rod shape-determining protein RodA [Thioflavicoccus mobilis 8321]
MTGSDRTVRLSSFDNAPKTGLLTRLHLDWPLLFGLLLLCGTGLLVLYSAVDQDLQRVGDQLLRLAIAFALMVAVAQIPPAQLRRWSFALFAAGVAMLVLVWLVGDTGKGAQRWLDLGIVRFQPSELLKLAVPMVLAWLFARRPLPPTFPQLLLAALIVLVPVVLIARQPDLGTALLVASAGVLVIFFAGLSWRLILLLGGLAAALAPVLWMTMRDYQRQRVFTFLNPESDPLGAGYHIIQSQIAIGSGGIHGKGWLYGTQSHLEFLPERSTDFIFAVLGEEHGLIGILAVLALYLFIIFRTLYIASQAQDTYGRLLAGGLAMIFFVYLFVNTGMVTGLLPVVGVPLPLISYGGTSLVTIMVGFGIVMAIHTQQKRLPV